MGSSQKTLRPMVTLAGYRPERFPTDTPGCHSQYSGVPKC